MHTIARTILQKVGLGLGVIILGNLNAQQWENVGTSPDISAGGSSFNNLVIDKAGNYYLSYYDLSVSKGTVQKFNGTSWSYVGGSPGITTSYATYNSLSLDPAGNNLYYTNQGSGLEVRHFNGASWAQLPSATGSTTNYQASAVSPSNTLFTYGSYGMGTVKRFVNGSWEQVGNSGFSNGAEFAEMVIGSDNKVYTSNVSGGLRVYQNYLTASSTDPWSLVGGSIVDAASSGEQYSADIAIDGNNNLYVAYVSSASAGKKINVKKFNGTSWTAIGNANFSEGQVQHVSLAVTESGNPYVVASRWENDDFLRNTVYKLDDSGQNWVTFGGNFVSEEQATYNDLAIDPVHNYLVLAYSEGSTKVKRISLAAGSSQTCNNADPGNNAGDTGCVTFQYRNQAVTYTTVRGADGKIWLQQNLGSSKTAESFTDTDSYGDLFQWGRWDDGHQLRSSTLSTSAPSPNNPAGIGVGSSLFYSAGYNSNSNWWSEGIPTDQWDMPAGAVQSEINGIDPCKAISPDWKVPSQSEVEYMIGAENISDITSALASHLKLVPAGIKDYNGIFSPETRLYLWTSTPSPYNGSAQHLYISQFSTLTNSGSRDSGQSVRCIKANSSLGTADLKPVVSVGVYPNPTKGIVNIKSDSLIEEVNLFNSTGQKLSIRFSDNQINMETLPNGVYFLNVKVKNGKTIIKKLIKN